MTQAIPTAQSSGQITCLTYLTSAYNSAVAAGGQLSRIIIDCTFHFTIRIIINNLNKTYVVATNHILKGHYTIF